MGINENKSAQPLTIASLIVSVQQMAAFTDIMVPIRSPGTVLGSRAA